MRPQSCIIRLLQLPLTAKNIACQILHLFRVPKPNRIPRTSTMSASYQIAVATHAPIFTTPTLMGGGDKGTSSSTNGFVIEISDYEGVDAPVFNAQEWIGCGKIWSDPMPVEVCAARSFYSHRWICRGLCSGVNTTPFVQMHEITTSGAQNAQHQWTETTLVLLCTSMCKSPATCKAFLCI